MTAHVTVSGWIWLAWAMFGISFEVYWILVNVANTLSYQIWGIERIDFAHPLDFAEWTPLHWTIGIALMLFFGWLLVHLSFGFLR
jgi:hypothetical protein